MKKLITLLLVLSVYVGTVSATDVTVYFKPNAQWKYSNAWFAICGQNSSGTDLYWVKMTEYSSGSGVYKATITLNDDCTKFIFCRMNPDDTETLAVSNRWNKSGDNTPPTTLSLYDISSVTWDSTWPEDWTTTAIVPSSKTFNISGEDNNEILPNYLDANSDAGINLTSNGDFTYSRTVTGNVIPAGSYGFKIYSGSDWYSDTENSYAAWPVSGISTTEDAVYTIEYSFNYLTQVGSATATKTGDATITTKYIIAGDNDLMGGYNWDQSGTYNVLDVTDGTGTLTINNLSLTGGTTYYYKAKRLLCNNDVVYKSFWYGGDNGNYYINRTGIYNATFTCTTSTLASSISSMDEQAGYYIYGGTGDWSLGGRMTESGGVYSYTFNGASGYSFVITPNENLNNGTPTVKSYGSVIRPNNSGAAVNVNWSNQNGNTEIADVENDKWSISFDGYVTINYTPGSPGTWSVTPYFERSINALKYTTFSSTYDVAIPAGITAKYATSVTGNTIDLADFSGGIPANAGALLYANIDESTSFKFYPPASAPSAATGNIFIPGDGTKITQTVGSGSEKKTNYILTNNTVNGTDQTLKFYLVNSGSGGNIVPVGKAYLQVPTPEGTAPEFFNFNFDFSTPTGISASLNRNEEIKDNKVFNLAGQRVMNPTKGLYIVNGRKVAIK